MLITFVSSKPMRLTTSSQVGSKVFGCVCAGSTLQLAKQSLDEAPYINCPKLSLSQSASPSVALSALLLIDEPWFLNWGKILLLYSSHLPLGVPNGPVVYFINSVASDGVMNIAVRFFLSKKPRFIIQERKEPNDWRWCPLACDSSGQFIRHLVQALLCKRQCGTCTQHNEILCSQLTMRLSVSPVCLKQRVWAYRVESDNSLRVK
jgi:hypothetical protein